MKFTAETTTWNQFNQIWNAKYDKGRGTAQGHAGIGGDGGKLCQMVDSAK